MTLNDVSGAADLRGLRGPVVGGDAARTAGASSFAAKDTGGGLYRVVVTADGKDVGGERGAGCGRALRERRPVRILYAF